MSLSYFDRTSVNDGTSATSTINLSAMVTALQTAYPGDTYFDSTTKIGYVYVYYNHTAGRQVKKVVHDPITHTGTAQWSSYAKDGTWQKNQIKVFDKDGAYDILYRANIGTAQDITHASGKTNLNIS